MDRRKRYTKKVIHETLFSLLKDQHLSKITVKEICNRADINRSTFYRNYSDIYDLFEKIEQELTKQAFESQNLFTDRYNILTIIYDHQEFYREFFQIGLESKQLRQTITELKNQTILALKKQGNFYGKSFDVEYQYNYFGALGVIKNWVNHGCKQSPKELGEILFSIVDRQYENGPSPNS